MLAAPSGLPPATSASMASSVAVDGGVPAMRSWMRLALSRSLADAAMAAQANKHARTALFTLETCWVSICLFRIPFDDCTLAQPPGKLVCLRSYTSPSGDSTIYCEAEVVFCPRTANRVTAHGRPGP